MSTIFMNSAGSETSHRLLLNPLDKINWKRSEIMFLYQTIAYTLHGKIIQKQ